MSENTICTIVCQFIFTSFTFVLFADARLCPVVNQTIGSKTLYFHNPYTQLLTKCTAQKERMTYVTT
nr:MAG TPA: hypothetical protein [Caudoviricetes sp.]